MSIPLEPYAPGGAPSVQQALQRIRWAAAAELVACAETTAWAPLLIKAANAPMGGSGRPKA